MPVTVFSKRTFSNVTLGPTPHANPVAGDFWKDTSASPWVLKQYDGTSWVTYTGAALEALDKEFLEAFEDALIATQNEVNTVGARKRLGSVAGVSPGLDGGDVALVAGANMSIVANDANDEVTFAAAAAAGMAIVETVAELEALVGPEYPDGEPLWLAGYHARGDAPGTPVRRVAASTATRNGVTVFTSADGGRWIREHPGYIDVRMAGAKFDDTTNDTAAIKAALDAARDSATTAEVMRTRRVVMPAASCVVTAYLQSTQAASIPTVHADLILEGAGYATELKIDPASYTTDGNVSYCPLFVKARAECRFFRINGQKASVTFTGTNYSTNGVYTPDDSTPDVILRELWCHDLKSAGKEGFGLASRNGATGWRWIRCRVYNIDGSGVSASGGAAGGGNHLIDGGKFYSNSWMGIAAWNLTDVLVIRDAETYLNSVNGLNSEWCERVEMWDCISRDNARAGSKHIGTKKIYHYDCVLRNNNTAVNLYASEIVLGSGGVNPLDNATVRYPERCEFHGGTVEPAAGQNHMYLDIGSTPSTAGEPGYARNIILNIPGAEEWLLNDGGAHDGKKHTPGARFPAVQVATPIHKEAAADFAAFAGGTTAAYAGTGHESPGAFTITSTGNQGVEIADMFAANRAYLLVARVRQEDAANWRVQAYTGASVTDPPIEREVQFINRSTSNGVFQLMHMIVPKSSLARSLRIRHNATGTSTFTVDWVAAYELRRY